MIGRRDFITLLGGAAAAWPLTAAAQRIATKPPRIGWLSTGDPESYRFSLADFRDGLRTLNYVEGQNIVIEYQWAQGNPAKLPELANELARREVDVIIAGGSLGAQAAQNATRLIPIVAAGVGDLVELGLVSNLAHPGGNLTGFVALAPEIAGKRAEIIRQIIPQAARAAVLWNPDSTAAQAEWKFLRESTFGTQLEVTAQEARALNDLEPAFAGIVAKKPDILYVANDPFMFTYRKVIAAFAARSRLPAIYGYREYVDDGGLISYGTSISDTYRRAASYVDKILKGDRVGDLPVDLPTRFELVINLKAAMALGISLPPILLALADEVIE
jgi:putative ABC transport system substrate-binding protein